MQTGTISVQTENIFPIIKKFLYSDHEIFLRELVSNAVDATSKLKVLAQRGEVTGEIGDTTVEVILKPGSCSLVKVHTISLQCTSAILCHCNSGMHRCTRVAHCSVRCVGGVHGAENQQEWATR